MATKKTKVIEERNGCFMYLGPTIRGVIYTSQMFVGKKSEILSTLAPAIQKYPQISQLIVEDTRISAAKKQIKYGGTAIAYAYKVLSDN